MIPEVGCNWTIVPGWLGEEVNEVKIAHPKNEVYEGMTNVNSYRTDLE